VHKWQPSCLSCGVLLAASRSEVEMEHAKNDRERREGKIVVPALLYIAGVPLSVVVLLWLFFFRG
jgi:hypothetical protein